MTRLLTALCLLAACRLELGNTLENGEIRGAVVVDTPEGRKPAVDARIRLEGLGTSVRSDARGRFTLRGLPDGRYTLRLTSGSGDRVDFGLRLRDVTIGSNGVGTGLDLGTLVLGAAATISGSVKRGGNVVAGASVVLVGVAETRTTATGAYRFEGVVPGDHLIGAAAANGTAMSIAAPTPLSLKGKDDRTVDLELAAVSTGSVSGIARLAGQTKHDGIEIRLERAGESYKLVEPTNADGFFADGSAPAGLFTVVLRKAGFRDAVVPHVLIGGDSAELPELVLLQGDGCGTSVAAGDADGDGTPDASEPDICRCDELGTKDTDDDLLCDSIDPDLDGDGVANDLDNCPSTPNATQVDTGGTAAGDACDDRDGDTILDAVDNCVAVKNTDQVDLDANDTGDACETTSQVFDLPTGECLAPTLCLEGPLNERRSPFAVSSAGGTTIFLGEGNRVEVEDGTGRRVTPVTSLLPAGAQLAEVNVVGPSEAYLVGSRAAVLKWNGTEWSRLPFTQAEPPDFDVTWATSEGLYVGESGSGIVWRMTGTAPADMSIPSDTGALRFLLDDDDGTLFAVTEYQVFRRYEASGSWGPDDALPAFRAPDPHSGGAIVSGAVMLDGKLFVAVFANGGDMGTPSTTVYRRDGNDAYAKLFEVPTPGPAKLDGTGPADLWVASGTDLFLWNGSTLHRMPGPSALSGELSDVEVIGSTRIVAVGPGGLELTCDGDRVRHVRGPGVQQWVSTSAGTTKLFAIDDGGGLFQGDGITWTLVPVPARGRLTSVLARTDTDVWVSGVDFEIHHLSGATWTDESIPDHPNEWTLLRGDATTLWVAGLRGSRPTSNLDFFHRSSTWIEVAPEGDAELGTFSATTSRIVYTETGGASWFYNLEADGWDTGPSFDPPLVDVWIDGSGKAVGVNGTSQLWTFTQGGATSVERAGPDVALQGITGDGGGNPVITVSGAGERQIFAVVDSTDLLTPVPSNCAGSPLKGENGKVFVLGVDDCRLDQQGNWVVSRLAGRRSINVDALWIGADGDGWASDGEGLLRRTPEGWVPFATRVEAARAVDGLAPDDVWSGGNAGGLQHFDGTAWQRDTPDDPALTVTGIYVAPSGSVWVLGSDGKVWSRAPTEGKWTARHDSVANTQWTAITGAGTDVWIAGYGHLEKWNGTAFVDDAGGLAVGELSFITANRSAAAPDVWAGGADALFHRDAAGWTAVPYPATFFAISGVAFVGGDVFLAAFDFVDSNRSTGTQKLLRRKVGGFDTVASAPGTALQIGHLASEGTRLWFSLQNGGANEIGVYEP